VAAITRRADREGAIAASTDSLAKRRIHDVEAAARFDWTRRSNRGTNRDDWLGPSKHRGGHEGLEGQAPGLHFDPLSADSLLQSTIARGALGGGCEPSRRVITTAAKRLPGSSMTPERGRRQTADAVDERPDFRGFRRALTIMRKPLHTDSVVSAVQEILARKAF
jgi:hypothetical protein